MLSLLQMMLIQGMTIQGSSEGDHYGAVSIQSPNERVESQGKAWGRRVAQLVKNISEVGRQKSVDYSGY